MRRNLFILLAVFVLHTVLAEDVHATPVTEKPVQPLEHKDDVPPPEAHPDVKQPEASIPETQQPQISNAELPQSAVHHSEENLPEGHTHQDHHGAHTHEDHHEGHTHKDHHEGHAHGEKPAGHPHEVHHEGHTHEDHHKEQSPDSQPAEHTQEDHHKGDKADEHPAEAQDPAADDSKQQSSTGRQFHPPPYHPMIYQQPSGFGFDFGAIRRQFGGGLGSDLVMVGLISLPIIGMLAMGSAGLGNLFGLGMSSSSKKSSSKRNRRSLKDKAADAVEYAKTLWNIMEQLEKSFEKYDLYQAECRLRVVCEAHHKDRRLGAWGQNILFLMRQQKELEGRELLPVSRFLFSNYAEAAQAGARDQNCAQLYTGCPRHLSYYLSAKEEDQMENEVEIGL